MDSLQLIGTSGIPGTRHDVMIPWHHLCDFTRVFLKSAGTPPVTSTGAGNAADRRHTQRWYDPAKEESHDAARSAGIYARELQAVWIGV